MVCSRLGVAVAIPSHLGKLSKPQRGGGPSSLRTTNDDDCLSAQLQHNIRKFISHHPLFYSLPIDQPPRIYLRHDQKPPHPSQNRLNR